MVRWVRSPAYLAAVEVVVEARRSAGLSQRDLAAKLGRPRSMIANIERGERQIDVVEFVAIAKALGEQPSEMMARVTKAIDLRDAESRRN